MIFQKKSPGVRPSSQSITVRRILLKSDMLEIFKESRILEYELDITVIAQESVKSSMNVPLHYELFKGCIDF